MNLFCDLHHRDLYYSLRLLFEKRLGFSMYRPIGLDWWKHGFWKVFDHPATANQYLALNGTQDPSDEQLVKLFHKRELQNVDYTVEDGIYYVNDTAHQSVERAVTFEQFKNMKFDIIIASIPDHILPFKELITNFQPKAKLIFQIGNPIQLGGWKNSLSLVQNIMSSTLPFSVPAGKHVVFYNQEFDLDVYQYKKSSKGPRMHSYVHNMENPGPTLFKQLQSLLKIDGQMYGAGMPESLFGARRVAEAMIDSTWTFHFKPRGDGYGHVLHSSYACGRPTIIDASRYKGMAGARLLEDGVSCIDFSRRTVFDTANKVRYFSHPDRYQKMCDSAYKRFTKFVNFDEDELNIRKFLERLL